MNKVRNDEKGNRNVSPAREKKVLLMWVKNDYYKDIQMP